MYQKTVKYHIFFYKLLVDFWGDFYFKNKLITKIVVK